MGQARMFLLGMRQKWYHLSNKTFLVVPLENQIYLNQIKLIQVFTNLYGINFSSVGEAIFIIRQNAKIFLDFMHLKHIKPSMYVII